MTTTTVEFDAERLARRILVGALLVEALLLVLNYTFNFFDVANDISVRRIFNIAREQSLPTFFASLQAVAVGATAFALWRLQRQSDEREGGWLYVAIFWAYIGIDDNAEIHERLGSAFERATEGSGLLSGFPSFAWQLFVAPVLAAGLLAAVVVAWRHVERGRPLLLACLACFAIAQGFDFMEGIEGLFEDWAASIGTAEYTLSHTFRAAEETLEMVGTTAYWAPTLWLLADRLRGRSVTFVGGAS